MIDKKELTKQLIKNKLMKTYEEVELYEKATNSLFNEKDSNCIFELINGFHDETENDEVMFSTLHGIEFFSKTLGLEKYIEIILPLLKLLQLDAYNWSETFYLRLLNSDKSFNILLSIIKGQKDEDKNIIENITRKLIKRNPNRFEEKGNKVLKVFAK